MNVIFHIDDLDKWATLISNVKNFRKLEAEGQIEVLVNGPAVEKVLLDSDISLVELQKLPNVQIAVCKNSLEQRKITDEMLQPNLVQVPAGVIELAQKELAGYAYIKP